MYVYMYVYPGEMNGKIGAFEMEGPVSITFFLHVHDVDRGGVGKDGEGGGRGRSVTGRITYHKRALSHMPKALSQKLRALSRTPKVPYDICQKSPITCVKRAQ